LCITTFSRADLLKPTLESMVQSESFQAGKVEIVISDNVSNDNTEEIGRSYHDRYPDRINYVRQPSPIDPHFNFEYVLNMGCGKFLKLNNDNIAYVPGSLDLLVRELEKLGDRAGIVLPENRPCCPKDYDEINSLDELIEKVSFQITAINLFCVKRDVYKKLDNPFRAWKIHFPHVDILFRLLNQGEKAIRLNHIAMTWQRIRYNSSNRNQAEEFAFNYISLLHREYVEGNLSGRIYRKEKIRTLFKQTIPLHFDFFHQFNTSKKPLPFWKYTQYYRRDWFFYIALVWIAFYWFTSNVIPIHQMLGWIKRNIFRIK